MNKRKQSGWMKHLDFMLLDIVCIQLAYFLAYQIRQPGYPMYRGTSLYLHISYVLLLADICYVVLYPVYKNIIKRSVFSEIRSVFAHNTIVWLLAIVYLFLTKQGSMFSRATAIYAIGFSFVFMMLVHVIWKDFIRSIIRKGNHQANMILVSSEDYAEKMIRRFRSRMYNGFRLKGLIIADADLTGSTIEQIPVVCNKDDMLDYIKQQAVDEVMIAIPDNTKGNRAMVFELLNMGVVVHLAVDYVDDAFPNAEMERIGGFAFLTTSINTAGGLSLFLKRLMDIAAGLLGCVIMAVAFIFVAPAIYVASPGPIFLRQERMGKNGRRFRMYKFRSMYMDAEERKKELMSKNEMDGLMFKIENDPRIIGSEKGPGKGIGNTIRRLSIDELPQFINILRGDMSLVGTRPPTVDEFNAYDYHHKVRLSMKPGLTGLWQVSGRNKVTNFEEIVRLDAEYIKNWSLRLDFKIILKTVAVVLRREGAK